MSYRSVLGAGAVQGVGLTPRHSYVYPLDGDATPVAWVRNPSWAALPSVTNTEQKFVGLHAVWPDSNFVAFTAAGNYTVDWGDGTATENIATGVQANHNYDYTAAGLANTNAPVTLTDSGDLVGRTAHGYSNGMLVQFYNIASTTGLTEGQSYYVINANANDFQVSATLGGSAVALTTNGTATLLPYKQAIVTITMQSGQNFTSLDLKKKHSQSGLVNNYASGWLDILVSGPNLTALVISSSSTTLVNHSLLEQAQLISSNSITSMANMFFGCSNLQSVPVFNTAACTSMTRMFQQCDSLQTIPLLSTANVTDMSIMFYQCYSLRAVPLLDTSAVTVANQMFDGCAALQTVPAFNFSVATTLASIFNANYKLQTVPAFRLKTSGTISLASMFSNCSSLRIAPLMNTVAVTNMSGMFSGCSNLAVVPCYDTSAVTTMANMFTNCARLVDAPFFNTAAVTTVASMFSGCSALQTVPLYNLAAATTLAAMFLNCSSLTGVPLFPLKTTGTVSLVSMFSGCNSLRSVPLFNTVAVTSMNAMFNSCFSLESVPLFDTSAVTDMSIMLYLCYNLKSVPLFNTAAVTNMQQMLQQCYSLTTVPAFNTSAVTNMLQMFNGCRSLKTIPLLSPKVTGTVDLTQMFLNCVALRGIPPINTVAVTNMNSMFSGCTNMEYVPALNMSAVTSAANLTSMFATNPNLASIKATGVKFTFSVASCKLSKTRLEELFGNLGKASSATLTVTSNYGVDTAVTKASLNTTAQSATVNVSNTSSLSTGMLVTGSGMGTGGVSVTSDVAADTLGLTAHGLPNGTPVSFSGIGTTTGIATYTTYYVVNTAANTFQIALTPGGSAINLTGSNATMTLLYANYIQSIVTNTSVTLTVPAASTQTGVTLTFRLLDAAPALLKGWTVTF